MIPAYKQARFHRLCQNALREQRSQGEAGIGTLAEKRLHAVIKRYLCEDEDCHEVGVLNTRYVSDVRVGNDVYEVQTGAFSPMKKKIDHYLTQTDCNVTVVHPIPAVKWVSWITKEGELLAPRKKSPKKERPENLLAELYCLREHLGNPRLKFVLLLIEAEDVRLCSARAKNPKKNAVRYERIPLALLDELEFSSPADFRHFIPDALPQRFTVKQFSDLTKIRGRDAYSAVRVLASLGLFYESSPIGRAMAWERTEPKPQNLPCDKS
ncbi:MAG: hypothetical protein IJF33_00770 [Clostridia bacterium]|nr:hypothetical protein [Clostridia bacterium]